MIRSCPGRITGRLNGARGNITAPLWPGKMQDNELKLHMQKMNELIREIVDYAADDWLLVYERKPVISE